MQTDLILELEPISQGGFGSIFNCKYKGKKYIAKKIPLLENGGFIDKPMEPLIMSSNIPYLNKHCGVLFDERNIYIIQDKAKSLKHVRRDGIVDYGKMLEWCKTLLTCLKHIHRYGFIHCDIKPDNILVLDNQSIVIADMGLLTITHGKYDRSIGTSSYRAPEVWNKGEKSASLDIWSLGLTFYYLIQGEDLFQVDSHGSTTLDKDTKKKLYKQQVDEWTNKYGGIYPNFKLHKSHPLSAIIMSMLNPNPKLRPGANELLKNKIFNNVNIPRCSVPELHILNNIDEDIHIRWIYELIKKHVKDENTAVEFSKWFRRKIILGHHIPIMHPELEDHYRSIERWLVCSRCNVPKI